MFIFTPVNIVNSDITGVIVRTSAIQVVIDPHSVGIDFTRASISIFF